MSEPIRRPGGRTAVNRARVLDATLAELAEHGYDRLSLEAVATRAGVHRTTVYRGYGDKERLVADALENGADVTIPVPDTGGVDEDLRLLARGVASMLAMRDGAAAVLALVAGLRGSPAVGRVVQRFWGARLLTIRPIVERAVTRGELAADTDARLLLAHMAAPLYYRMLLTTEPLTDDFADLCAAATLTAARAGLFRSTEAAPPPLPPA